MFSRIYVCMDVNIILYIYICTYVCIHLYMYLFVLMYLCMYACLHLCVLGKGKMDFWPLNPVMRLEILLIKKAMSILIIDWIN